MAKSKQKPARKHVRTRPRPAELEPQPELARLAITEALGSAEPATDPAPAPGGSTPAADPAPAPGGSTPEPSSSGSEPEPELEPGPAGETPPEREARARRGRKSRTRLEEENRELRKRLELGGVTVRDKRKEPPPPPDPAVSELEATQMSVAVLQFVFGILATQRGAHWEMPDDEGQRIGKHFGKALAPWLPALGDSLPYIFGGIALADAVRRRAAQDGKSSSEAAPSRPQPQPAAQPEGPPPAREPAQTTTPPAQVLPEDDSRHLP